MQDTTPNETAAGESRNFEAILAQAAKRRPLQPKSLIMTIFGDSVVPRGGVIWLGNIVSLAAEFGLAEPLVRTSALRLAYDGWLVRRQSGKLSYYSMTDAYAAADAAYRSQIYSASGELRQNGWTIFRMFNDRLDRKAAYKLRKALDRYGFGQLAPQVFVHPSIAKSAVHHIISSSGKGEDAGITFFCHEMEQNRDLLRHLLSAAWDLTEVRQGYEDFIASFDALPALLDKHLPTPAVAFGLRTLMVHKFRRLALRDPKFPEEFFEDGWPGEKAFQLISNAYRRLLPRSEAYLDKVFQVQGGPPSAADERLFKRFSSVA